MKRFLKENGWYASMVAGIGLLMSSIVADGELFTGQTILAVLLIVNPTPSVQYPISPLSQDQYAKSCTHCMRTNQYYLKLKYHIPVNLRLL